MGITPHGRFVIVDGVDGAGKTGLAKHLASAYNGIYVQVVGSSPISDAVRVRVMDVTKEHDSLDQVYWMLAAIRETYRDQVFPALQEGKNVFVDRWFSSLYAYQLSKMQCEHSDILKSFVMDFNTHGMHTPDLYLYCNLAQEIAQARIAARGNADRFDSFETAEQHRISAAYEHYYNDFIKQGHVAVKLNCEFSEGTVQRMARHAVEEVFQEKPNETARTPACLWDGRSR